MHWHIFKYICFHEETPVLLHLCISGLYQFLSLCQYLLCRNIDHFIYLQDIKIICYIEDIRLIDPGEHKGTSTLEYFRYIVCHRKMKEPSPWWSFGGWGWGGSSLNYFRIAPPQCRESNGTPLQYSFAWKIPWMEEPGRLQSMGLLRVGHDWATSLSLFTFVHQRRKWQPTLVFLPGESQGRGSLVGCLLWGRTESDTTEATQQQQQQPPQSICIYSSCK